MPPSQSDGSEVEMGEVVMDPSYLGQKSDDRVANVMEKAAQA